MNSETFTQNNNTLMNINKTNETYENIDKSNTNLNINEKDINQLKIPLKKSKSIKDIKQNNDSSKENLSKSLKSFMPINTINNTTDKPFISNVKDEKTHFSNYHINDTTKNNQNDSNVAKIKSRPSNLKNFYKAKTLKFIGFPKKTHSIRKNSLIRKINNKNNVIKEEEKTARDKIFTTEINMDLSNIKENSNPNNINNNNIINSKTTNNFYQYSMQDIKKNKSTDSNKYNKKKLLDDPLLISKEDLIFEEIKKYKCFKYFTQEALNKTGVPFIYIQMNMNPEKFILNKNNNINEGKSFNNKFLLKLLKSGKEKVFLSKGFNKDLTDDKKKELLEDIYRVKTSPDFYRRIEIMKGKKDKKKLKNYQNNLLKIVKHNISNKYYESLKDKFSEIREAAEGKYKTNFKFIKEIEKTEENVINNINQICNSYTRYFATKNLNKLFVKSIGPRIKLPQLKFIKMANKDFFSGDEKISKLKRKPNFISLKKFMNKTTNKFHKDNFGLFQNKEKHRFSSTNYRQFTNLKSYSTKKF